MIDLLPGSNQSVGFSIKLSKQLLKQLETVPSPSTKIVVRDSHFFIKINDKQYKLNRFPEYSPIDLYSLDDDLNYIKVTKIESKFSILESTPSQPDHKRKPQSLIASGTRSANITKRLIHLLVLGPISVNQMMAKTKLTKNDIDSVLRSISMEYNPAVNKLSLNYPIAPKEDTADKLYVLNYSSYKELKLNLLRLNNEIIDKIKENCLKVFDYLKYPATHPARLTILDDKGLSRESTKGLSRESSKESSKESSPSIEKSPTKAASPSPTKVESPTKAASPVKPTSPDKKRDQTKLEKPPPDAPRDKTKLDPPKLKPLENPKPKASKPLENPKSKTSKPENSKPKASKPDNPKPKALKTLGNPKPKALENPENPKSKQAQNPERHTNTKPVNHTKSTEQIKPVAKPENKKKRNPESEDYLVSLAERFKLKYAEYEKLYKDIKASKSNNKELKRLFEMHNLLKSWKKQLWDSTE